MATFRGGGGGWDGFGQYMRDKTLKLAGQFGSRYEKTSVIFQGLTFWSTGRIEGIDFDIKEALTAHGGTYEQYGFRNVSHIIASNVALSNQNWKKLLGGRFASKPYKIVTPQWISESIIAGKTLPESDFLPECIKVKGTLESFLRLDHQAGSPQDDMLVRESTQYTLQTGASSGSSRLMRVDIASPRVHDRIVEEVCSSLLDVPLSMSRGGYLTLHSSGTVIVQTLDFSTPKTSLAQALTTALSDRALVGIERLSVSAFTRDNDEPALDILPCSEAHPSSERTRYNKLTERLVRANEDEIRHELLTTMHESGVGISAIILDSISALISSRRLDAAQQLLKYLQQQILNSDNMHAQRWYGDIMETAQHAFRISNEGASLAL